MSAFAVAFGGKADIAAWGGTVANDHRVISFGSIAAPHNTLSRVLVTAVYDDLVVTHIYPRAFFTRSSVNGACRRRTPVRAIMAFDTAGVIDGVAI